MIQNLSRLFAFAFSFLLLFESCQPVVDIEVEKEKIVALMKSSREAHFNNSAVQFLAPIMDSFTEVRNGRYMKMTKSGSLPGLQSYFENMEFLELEDVQKPLISISDDATLATYTISIIVRGYLNKRPLFSKMASHMTLKKADGQWKIISNVNTSTPEAGLGSVILDRVKNQWGQLPDSVYVYANAECTGPTDPFKTLVLSGKSGGRMEQLSSDAHLILQHQAEGSWMKDVKSGDLREGLDEGIIGFIIGHEFHWLCFRPEDRLASPEFSEYATFDDVTAFKLSFTDAVERPVHFYYGFDDYRPLGFDYPSHRENEWIRSYFSNWSEVDGVSVFRKVKIDEGENRWEYNFTEIRLDSIRIIEYDNKEPLL